MLPAARPARAGTGKMLCPFVRTRWIVVVYVVVALVVSIHKYMLPSKPVEGREQVATEYNNYVIFERSGAHLLAGDDHRDYPDEHWDPFNTVPPLPCCGAADPAPAAAGPSLWNLDNPLVLLGGYCRPQRI